MNGYTQETEHRFKQLEGCFLEFDSMDETNKIELLAFH